MYTENSRRFSDYNLGHLKFLFWSFPFLNKAYLGDFLCDISYQKLKDRILQLQLQNRQFSSRHIT